MKKTQVLSNQNKLYSETTTEAFYSKETTDFSIRCVFKGNEEYFFADKNLNILPNYFLVVNEGTSYSRKIDTDTPADIFSLSFSKTFLADFHRSVVLSDDKLLDTPFDTGGVTPFFVETLYPFKNDIRFNLTHLKAHFDSGVNNEPLMNGYLYHALLLFYKIHNKEVFINRRRLNLVKACTQKEVFKRLNNVKDYLISNYDKDITIGEMSRIACLSECHLYKLFKELYQCSPHQYLLNIRLDRARYLLTNTRYSINEIVIMVGFENPSSFIRLFKKRFSFTPKAYGINSRLAIA